MAKSPGSALLPKPSVLRAQEGRAQRELSRAPHAAGQSSQGCLGLPLPTWRTPSIRFLQENACFAFLPLVGCQADTRLAARKVFARKDNFAKGSPALKSISHSVSPPYAATSLQKTHNGIWVLPGRIPTFQSSG